jgi:hypothetical protein
MHSPNPGLAAVISTGGVMRGENGQHPMNGSIRSLVLRGWLEPDASPPLRVRIVEIDRYLSERPMIVTASVDDACNAVRRWLEVLQAQGTGRFDQ